jgi:hypothetical protein
MKSQILLRNVRLALLGALIVGVAACGSGSGSDMSSSASTSSTTPSSAQMSVMMSDASSDDWSLIGVKIQSIALVAQDGTAVTVYSPAQPVMVNLVQLDNIRDILNDATVPAGTYTAAILTLSANPGDVVL